MKLTDLRPILWTEDMKTTIGFYREVLGFSCNEYNEDWGWASLSKDGVSLMLSKPNRHTTYDKIGFTGSFYFNTEDAEMLWNELKGKVKVCYELETFEWGMKEFAIF